MSIKTTLRSWADRIGLSYATFLAKREFLTQQFLPINERPVEYQLVFKYLALACPRSVLDVGTGATALPQVMRTCGFLVTATDNIRDYWPRGMVNRHYHVLDDDITRTRLTQKFDFITCISVLEHIRDHGSAMHSLVSLLNPGGHLIVTFPYNEDRYAPNVYDLPDSAVRVKPPFITQAFSRMEVDAWLSDGEAVVVEQEYWRFFSGAYWTCGERICPPVLVSSSEPHQISCLVLRKRRP